uniref:C2H2-type domain-containing protein n=1 Tax=Compsopogon caeruleus TaxID=31354 RepID=A0A7S1T5E9_9RHOD
MEEGDQDKVRGDRMEWGSVRATFAVLDNERPLVEALTLRVLSSISAGDWIQEAVGRGLGNGKGHAELPPRTQRFSVVLFPQMFLDEDWQGGHGRLVAGTAIEIRGSSPSRPGDPGSKNEQVVHGRFVLDLQHASECVLSFPFSRNFVSVRVFRVGAQGFRAKSGMVLQKGIDYFDDREWPESARSTVQICDWCSRCLDERIACACSASVKAMNAPKGPRKHTTWSSFLRFYYSVVPSVAVSSMVFSFSGRGSNTLLSYGRWDNGIARAQSVRGVGTHYLGHSRMWSEVSLEPMYRSELKTPSTPRPRPHRTKRAQQICASLLRSCNFVVPQCLSKVADKVPSKPSSSRSLCNVCGRSFPRPSRLAAHMAISHEGKSLFRCLECEGSFHSQANLNRHARMVHQKIRRFFCNSCGRGFYAERDRRRHQEKC